LPKFCFCDVGHQCKKDDAPKKQKCKQQNIYMNNLMSFYDLFPS